MKLFSSLIFLGLLLAPLFTRQGIMLIVLFLLILGTVLLCLLHRGIANFQDYE